MRAAWYAGIAGGLLLTGFLLGRASMPGPVAVRAPEPPAKAVIHPDGSQTLARVETPPPTPLPEPPGTVARTRAAIFELRPLPEPSTIQMDLVTLKDGTQRITAKGPALVGGVDFPVSRIEHPANWTIGTEWDGMTLDAIGVRHWKVLDLGVRIVNVRHPQRVAVFVGFDF